MCVQMSLIETAYLLYIDRDNPRIVSVVGMQFLYKYIYIYTWLFPLPALMSLSLKEYICLNESILTVVN